MNSKNTTSKEIKLPGTESTVTEKFPDQDVELIEDNERRNEVEVLREDEKRTLSFIEDKWPALLAGLFAVIAVFVYLGLFLWKRLLE